MIILFTEHTSYVLHILAHIILLTFWWEGKTEGLSGSATCLKFPRPWEVKLELSPSYMWLQGFNAFYEAIWLLLEDMKILIMN